MIAIVILGQTGETTSTALYWTSIQIVVNMKWNFARHIIDSDNEYTDCKTNFKPIHLCKKGALHGCSEKVGNI